MKLPALAIFALLIHGSAFGQTRDALPDPAMQIVGRSTPLQDASGVSSGERILIYPAEPGEQGRPVLRVVANQAIVQLDDKQLKAARARTSSTLKIESLGVESSFYLLTAIDPEVLDPLAVIKLFAEQTGLREIRHGPNIVGSLDGVQDRIYPRDLEPWAHANAGNRSGPQQPKADADIDASQALSRLRFTRPVGPISRTPLIMMIDSSIDTSHSALRHSLWTNPGEVPGNGLDDDGNGLIDDVHGWNFVGNTGQLTDSDFHGTHVAGIMIADPAPDTGAVKGLAVGARLMTAKVGVTPTAANVTKAINYALVTNASVVNMSLSFDFEPLGLREAILALERAGTISVASAGNKGNNLQQNPVWPCMYVEVVCVGMTNDRDELDPRSNWFPANSELGTAGVAIAAPGIDIRSTSPGGLYRVSDGTSMAAPMVAGVMAAVLRQFPTATHNEVRRRVLNTADRVETLPFNRVEQGRRLNLYSALFEKPRHEFATDDYCNVPIRDPDTNQSYPRRTNSPFANFGEPGIDGLSPTTAYTICSVAQLVNIQDSFLDKIFVLRADLVWPSDVSGSSAYNIGGRSSTTGVFIGILDGAGHTIERLGEGQSPQSAGLIAELGPGGRVSNLRLRSVRIIGSGVVGAVARQMREGRIDNVQVDGRISGTFVGGLVGEAVGGTISLSSVEGHITGFFATGGLVGQMTGPNALIDSSSFSGVAVSRAFLGGIVGRANNRVTIRRSFAALNVPQEGASNRRIVGGLVGSLECGSRLEDSFAEGEISATRYTGTLVGQMYNSDLERVFGSVFLSTDNDTSGGTVGYIKDDSVSGDIYRCSGTATLPPPSTRIDDIFDSFIGGTGYGVATSPQDMRKSNTYMNWSHVIWDIENGSVPRLKRMLRSTHPDY